MFDSMPPRSANGQPPVFDWSIFNSPMPVTEAQDMLLSPVAMKTNSTSQAGLAALAANGGGGDMLNLSAYSSHLWPASTSQPEPSIQSHMVSPGPACMMSPMVTASPARTPVNASSQAPIYLVYDPTNGMLSTQESMGSGNPSAAATLQMLGGLSGAQSPAPGYKHQLTINQLAEQLLLREGISLEEALRRLCTIGGGSVPASPGGSVSASPSRQHSLYKTELCRSWEETGTCRYGAKCQFAHGREELRPVQRHPKYKTEICRTFATTGTCPYGTRCRFIHYAGNPSALAALCDNRAVSEGRPAASSTAQQAQLMSPMPSPLPTPMASPARPPSQVCRALSFGESAPQQPPASPGGRRLPVFVNLAQKGEPEGAAGAVAGEPLAAGAQVVSQPATPGGYVNGPDITALAQALNQLHGGNASNLASVTNAIALLQNPELASAWVPRQQQLTPAQIQQIQQMQMQQQLAALQGGVAPAAGIPAAEPDLQQLAAQLLQYGQIPGAPGAVPQGGFLSGSHLIGGRAEPQLSTAHLGSFMSGSNLLGGMHEGMFPASIGGGSQRSSLDMGQWDMAPLSLGCMSQRSSLDLGPRGSLDLHRSALQAAMAERGLNFEGHGEDFGEQVLSHRDPPVDRRGSSFEGGTPERIERRPSLFADAPGSQRSSTEESTGAPGSASRRSSTEDRTPDSVARRSSFSSDHVETKGTTAIAAERRASGQQVHEVMAAASPAAASRGRASGRPRDQSSASGSQMVEEALSLLGSSATF